MALIFYKQLVKSNNKPKQKNLQFSIFANGIENVDDSVSEPASCKSFYNLSFIDGALKTGLGFKEFSVPSSHDNLQDQHTFNFSEALDEIDGIWLDRVFRADKGGYDYFLVMIDSSFVLWQVFLIDEYDGYIFPKSYKLTSSPTFQCAYRTDNKDCCLFFSNEGMLYLALGEEGVFTNVPAMISCVVHYDNFFGITNTNRNTLVYTKNLNPKNWAEEESSTIEFLDNRGSFNKLVAFNDYVYLFRENGITKISLYNSKDNFSFTHLYTSSSKIFENSVCVCGDKILFLTRDGLYSFNGNSVNKVAKEYDIFFKNCDNIKCSSACLDGKYYLATNCNFEDDDQVGCESFEHVNNVLFEIDINNFNVNLYRGVDIRKILAIDNPYMSKLCACFYNENKQKIGELTTLGKTFDKTNVKMWQSHKNDLGYSGKKRIKEISILTKYPCTLTISSDCDESVISFEGSDFLQKKRLNVFGHIFQFTFKTNEVLCDIKKPTILFDIE